MKTQLLIPLSVAVLLAGCNVAQEVPADRGSDLSDITPGTAPTAAARGTLALIKLQSPTGAFSGPAKTDHLGITGLAALALLSSNDVAPSTTEGPLLRATNFLLNSQRDDGYIFHEGDGAGMYGHAFATLFLTQMYHETHDAALKARLDTAIKKAVHLLETAQNPEGGWRYVPKPADADVSVTSAEMKALAAARDVGFAVSDKTIANAISYLKANQQPDGGFSYTERNGASGWARSAAATAAMLYASTTGFDTGKALAYLQQPATAPDSQDHFFYYGNYYLAQALNLDPSKTKSADSLRAAVLERQDPHAYLWTGEAGPAYATAMSLIILYMPDSRLPAFKPPTMPPATQPATAP